MLSKIKNWLTRGKKTKKEDKQETPIVPVITPLIANLNEPKKPARKRTTYTKKLEQKKRKASK